MTRERIIKRTPILGVQLLHKRIIKRTPILGVQLLHKTDGTHILVGIDGLESFSLGPYEQVDIADALAVVATDIRLDNKFGSTFNV